MCIFLPIRYFEKRITQSPSLQGSVARKIHLYNFLDDMSGRSVVESVDSLLTIDYFGDLSYTYTDANTPYINSITPSIIEATDTTIQITGRNLGTKMADLTVNIGKHINDSFLSKT